MTVNPDNKYLAEGLLRVEEKALQLLFHLPSAKLERDCGAIYVNYLSGEGIVVLAMRKAVEFRLPTSKIELLAISE